MLVGSTWFWRFDPASRKRISRHTFVTARSWEQDGRADQGQHESARVAGGARRASPRPRRWGRGLAEDL